MELAGNRRPSRRRRPSCSTATHRRPVHGRSPAAPLATVQQPIHGAASGHCSPPDQSSPSAGGHPLLPSMTPSAVGNPSPPPAATFGDRHRRSPELLFTHNLRKSKCSASTCKSRFPTHFFSVIIRLKVMLVLVMK